VFPPGNGGNWVFPPGNIVLPPGNCVFCPGNIVFPPGNGGIFVGNVDPFMNGNCVLFWYGTNVKYVGTVNGANVAPFCNVMYGNGVV
jgi:hypothetical protein